MVHEQQPSAPAKAKPENDGSHTNVASIASRRLPIAIVIALTVLSGVVHGHLDGRWANPTGLEEQGQRLNELPERAGDWVLAESQQLKKPEAKLLRCYGSAVRVYRNEQTGTFVNVAILLGPRGPIAVHTPEVCYSSVGTKQVGETRAESFSAAPGRHQLWTVQFSKDPSPEPVLEVWYGWSDGGSWQASKHPRFWLTESLYKIQVAGPVGDGSHQPCRDFLQAFLPEVNKVIQ